MTWQDAIVLRKGEQALQWWDGNCERQHKTIIPQKGLIRTKYKTVQSKETHSGTLVLTNQRLLWFERRGFMSRTLRASFEIDLLNLQGIAVGGIIKEWISITDGESENIFHLYGVGANTFEPFRKTIYDQIENLRASSVTPTTPTTQLVTKEIITREIVMIPCAYCKSLMPQTATFCPECGARRKG